MISFYTDKELEKLGLKHFGKNVLISKYARIYGAEKISIGNNVRIDDFCILSGHIEICDFIHIAAYSALYGGEDGIYVSDYANLSSRVSIYSVCDDFSGRTMTNPMIPDIFKNVKSAQVYIGKHVIIGSTSVILPGVNLAEGSAYGSFSLVTTNSEPWSINAGIPAKRIKSRSKDLEDVEEDFLKWMQIHH